MTQMDWFVHHANIEKFRKQLADTTDPVRRQTLLELLASEEDKDKLLPGNTASTVVLPPVRGACDAADCAHGRTYHE